MYDEFYIHWVYQTVLDPLECNNKWNQTNQITQKQIFIYGYMCR